MHIMIFIAMLTIFVVACSSEYALKTKPGKLPLPGKNLPLTQGEQRVFHFAHPVAFVLGVAIGLIHPLPWGAIAMPIMAIVATTVRGFLLRTHGWKGCKRSKAYGFRFGPVG